MVGLNLFLSTKVIFSNRVSGQIAITGVLCVCTYYSHLCNIDNKNCLFITDSFIRNTTKNPRNNYYVMESLLLSKFDCENLVTWMFGHYLSNLDLFVTSGNIFNILT